MNLATGLERSSRWRWLRLLSLGALTWCAAVVALGITKDPDLIPALGGTLSILLAALGEYLLLDKGVLRYLGVGLIEEAAKLVGLWRGVRPGAGTTYRLAVRPRLRSPGGAE
jgi:hypothetical protein